MPRGRPSLRGATARASPSPASSLKELDNGTRRLTRSGASKQASPANTDRSITAAPSAENPAPIAPRTRSRPSRTSMLADDGQSAACSPSPAGSAPLSIGSRRGKATARGTASTSSAPPSNDVSTDGDLSTPATSKFPTPVANDALASSKASGSRVEVRLPARSQRRAMDPERALRNSVYSLDNKLSNTPVDTDLDDDYLSDSSLGARAARRLQEAEDSRLSSLPGPKPFPPRRSDAPLAPALTATSHKRGRSLTGSSDPKAPATKKSKVVADSDDSELSEINVDAEVAAGASLDDDELSDIVCPQDLISLADEIDPDEQDEGALFDSDSEPIMASRRSTFKARESRARTIAKTASSRAVRPPRAPAPPSDFPDEIENSEPGEDGALSEFYASSDPNLHFSEATSVSSAATSDGENMPARPRITERRRAFRRSGETARIKRERSRLEHHHPELITMWTDLKQMPVLKVDKAPQPQSISRRLKPFQLEGLAWMKEMEKQEWRGGLLGDEMGLGKTIQAVSLIMSDYPASQPSLVLVPPVALMQWQSEIQAYTDGRLKTFVFHGTNQKTKGITVKELKKYDVLMMSYNSLESMYRKQERGFKRKDGIHKEKSLIHSINFHRIILDEAHCIKTRTTMTAKACFALKTNFRWCLTGTPLQNRIGELFSLIRFLNIKPFASYLCKQCPCSSLEWNMGDTNRCRSCNHAGMQHVSVFNQELLNPIQKFGNMGPGHEAFKKLRLMTERIMLRRLKKDHTDAMELPVKEIYVDRQFFGEEENDFANSIMTNGQRKFDTYVAQGVLLNNYANIFGLIMQMRQVADHPDLLLKKNAEGGQNVLVCCICDESAEDTVRSRCKHEFCRACVASYIRSTDAPDCPRCHIPLSIDLEQPEIEQDETLVKKSSIVNRIKMENWTSSSKIELLVHELHKLRSDNASHKSIIFSQFTTMLQLIEWRLRRAGITTVMLDGSMTPAQRQASIEHFMNKVDVECFLVSLKAGGVALNLTEASRVFIVDPWWNPAAEWQSADRCHRIGQTRPCTITRLCIEDSVESRMVLIQEKKTSMIHSTVNGDDRAMESLTPEDMQFLFRGS